MEGLRVCPLALSQAHPFQGCSQATLHRQREGPTGAPQADRAASGGRKARVLVPAAPRRPVPSGRSPHSSPRAPHQVSASPAVALLPGRGGGGSTHGACLRGHSWQLTPAGSPQLRRRGGAPQAGTRRTPAVAPRRALLPPGPEPGETRSARRDTQGCKEGKTHTQRPATRCSVLRKLRIQCFDVVRLSPPKDPQAS